eukprot:69982_1
MLKCDVMYLKLCSKRTKLGVACLLSFGIDVSAKKVIGCCLPEYKCYTYQTRKVEWIHAIQLSKCQEMLTYTTTDFLDEIYFYSLSRDIHYRTVLHYPPSTLPPYLNIASVFYNKYDQREMIKDMTPLPNSI